MSLIAARKQLQKELSSLQYQSGRIETALAALNGQGRSNGQKKFSMSAAARRRISIGIRKARAAKVAKAKSSK